MSTGHTCRICGLDVSVGGVVTFKKNGTTHTRKTLCNACDKARKRDYRRTESGRSVTNAAAERRKQKRAAGSDPDEWICVDSRKSDRKRGRENNLDREFIRNTIANGCSYCGETDLRMTLDRIDNELGHTQANVVPACIRCNYARRDMPYEAWLVIARGMREARETGLFGTWTGRVR